MKKSVTGKLILGSFLILLGTSFLLNQLPFINFNIFSLWPVILVVFGISQIFQDKLKSAIILIAVGVVFLLSNLKHINIWAYAFPISVLVIGISMLFKEDKSTTFRSTGAVKDTSNFVKETAIFWGIDKRIESNSFQGGDITAIFGGAKIDLTKAKVAKDGGRLDVVAIFGAGEILVPKGMKVKVDGVGIFGGVENKTSSGATGSVLVIDGTAIFGGISVKEV